MANTLHDSFFDICFHSFVRSLSPLLFACLFSSGSLLFDFDRIRNIIRMEIVLCVVSDELRTKTFYGKWKMIRWLKIEDFNWIKSVATIVEQNNLTFSRIGRVLKAEIPLGLDVVTVDLIFRMINYHQ